MVLWVVIFFFIMLVFCFHEYIFVLWHFISFVLGFKSLSCTIFTCRITVSYFLCIIYKTYCFFVWRACILKTIKIPTTIMIVWGQPIQTNFSSVHAWIFCTCVMPIWKKWGFFVIHLCKIKNVSQIPTHNNIMSQILLDQLANVMNKKIKNKKIKLYLYNTCFIGRSILDCSSQTLYFFIFLLLNSQ